MAASERCSDNGCHEHKPAATTAKQGTLRRAWGTFVSILRQRCPRCRTGQIFRGTFAMNDPCPSCGLLFQREEGFFLGAMYLSYPMSFAILLPLFLAAIALFPNGSMRVLPLLAMIAYLPFVPAVFRYSRVLWIYLDRVIDPNGALAGTYEKMRLRQLAESKEDRGASQAGR